MTVALSSSAAVQPLVRIRRAPALEPPVDGDRRTDDHPVCAGQLALFTSVHGRRLAGGGAVSARRPGARRRITSAEPSAGPSGRETRPGPAPGIARPPASTTGAIDPPATVPAGVAAARFVAACVEVLNGFRPVGHLRALTTTVEFTGVEAQLTRRAVRVRLPGRDRAGRERVRVRRVRVFAQHSGAVDAVAVLGHGETSWAIALRFEQHSGGWLCTLLEVV